MEWRKKEFKKNLVSAAGLTLVVNILGPFLQQFICCFAGLLQGTPQAAMSEQ